MFCEGVLLMVSNGKTDMLKFESEFDVFLDSEIRRESVWVFVIVGFWISSYLIPSVLK